MIPIFLLALTQIKYNAEISLFFFFFFFVMSTQCLHLCLQKAVVKKTLNK